MSLDVNFIIGSKTDLPAVEASKMFGLWESARISWNLDIISADRNPDILKTRCDQLLKEGVKVILAAAGMAARLPGTIAGHFRHFMPVIGVALPSEDFPDALDSVFSIARPPAGCPVGCAGVGSTGLRNAALFIAQMLKSKSERPSVSIFLADEKDFQTIKEAGVIDTLSCCKLDWQRLAWSEDSFIECYEGAIKKGTKIFITSFRFANLFKKITDDIQSAPLVISVPLPSDKFPDAKTALESITRLPADFPVVSTGIGKAGLRNAALFAAQILANGGGETSIKIKDGLSTYFNSNRKEPQLSTMKSQI